MIKYENIFILTFVNLYVNMISRTQKTDIMKTTVVLLAICCSLLLMPNMANAQARSGKSYSCLALIYPYSPTTSIEHADNYRGPMVNPVKKNLKKLTGAKIKTKNHNHAKRNFKKLTGVQRETTNHDHQVSETFANYDRMKRRSR